MTMISKSAILVGALVLGPYANTLALSRNQDLQRHRTVATQRRSLLALYGEADGDSEWYAPPPPKKIQPAPKLPWGVVPDVREIRTNDDFLEFLEQDERLCLVKFHALWCKNCQKFNIHFDKFAKERSDWINKATGEVVRQNDLRMASVEHSVARKLCESLGVEKLPCVFLYCKGRKLTEVSVGASKFDQVRDAVERYGSFSPKDREFIAKIQDGGEMINANLLQAAAARSHPSTIETFPSAKDPVAGDALDADHGQQQQEPQDGKLTPEEDRRAKIASLLNTSTARTATMGKKWWTHQTKKGRSPSTVTTSKE